jgi:hypothetical protein
MRYSRMRELSSKPKLTKKEQREINAGSAGMPPCRPARPHAERDDNGNVIRFHPIGRAARRNYMNNRGMEQLSRSRVQRLVRRPKTGGWQ